MAKFYGKIGYGLTAETVPGVWKATNVEKDAIGEYVRNINRNKSSDKVNDDITLQNTISIVMDPYAAENFRFIKYVKIDGVAWKVNSVEVQWPRLILDLGGEYNAQ